MGTDRGKRDVITAQQFVGLGAQRAAPRGQGRSLRIVRERRAARFSRTLMSTPMPDTAQRRVEPGGRVAKRFARDALDQCAVDRTTRHALADGDAEPRTPVEVGRAPGRPSSTATSRPRAVESRTSCGQHRRKLLRPTQRRSRRACAHVRANVARSGKAVRDPRHRHARHTPCPRRQTARRLRPLARRAAMTARPPRDFMRTRNPCVRARFTLEG